MKKLAVLFFLVGQLAYAQQKPQVAFVVKEKDLIPEGIAYDAKEKAFYLSSIQKKKIVKITDKGNVTDFIKSGQDSVQQVLGMRVDMHGRLWACNNTPEHDTLNRIANVHVYDLKTEKLINRYKLQDGTKHLFNDLYFTQNGDAYLTDSEAGGIYVIRNNSKSIEEFVKPGSMRYPNGIAATANEKKLLVSTGSALGIVAIDLNSKTIEPITHDRFLIIGTDGLYRYKPNILIGVQNVLFPEAIIEFHVTADAEKIESMNFVCSNDPAFDTPTTGVIVGDEFYFIANSQLMQIIGNKGNIKNPEKLNDTIIMKIKLN
jgi:hypothetical protein